MTLPPVARWLVGLLVHPASQAAAALDLARAAPHTVPCKGGCGYRGNIGHVWKHEVMCVRYALKMEAMPGKDGEPCALPGDPQTVEELLARSWPVLVDPAMADALKEMFAAQRPALLAVRRRPPPPRRSRTLRSQRAEPPLPGRWRRSSARRSSRRATSSRGRWASRRRRRRRVRGGRGRRGHSYAPL